MAIAATDQMEWVPTSSASNPRTSLPMVVTQSRIWLRTCLDVMRLVIPSAFLFVQTGESAEVPGMLWIWQMMQAHMMTGHMAASLVQCIVMVMAVPFIVLLKLECDGDAVSQVECWGVMGKFVAVVEELDVPDHKKLSVAFFELGDLAVLT